MSEIELTQDEIEFVLDAAKKAKNGQAKPIMFFGNVGIRIINGQSTLEPRLQMVDFMQYQKHFEERVKKTNNDLMDIIAKMFYHEP